MKWIKNLGFGLVLVWVVDSCVKEPSYPIVPLIELKNIIFKKGHLTPSPVADTLIFVLTFKDGDGDLGIGAEDSLNFDFYNPWYWAYNTSDFSLAYTVDNSYPLPSGYAWLDYKARNLPQFASLPDLNCKNWQLQYDNGSPQKVIDTTYITQNLKAYNINVYVFTKNSSTGGYDSLQLPGDKEMGCNPNLFRATFPDLSNDRKNSPLDGTLTFRIQSLNLYNLLKSYTLKMDIYINDRAFHQSNVVEKKDFTLQQITK